MKFKQSFSAALLAAAALLAIAASQYAPSPIVEHHGAALIDSTHDLLTQQAPTKNRI